MAGYLDIAGLKLRSVMPPEFFDQIEARQAGWLAAQSEALSRAIDSRLRKRYAVPFASPYPEAVLRWLGDMLTEVAWLRRGVDPSDPQWVRVEQLANTAREEIKEAADSNDGLFELPLATGATAVSKGGPRVYSEQSPYVAADQQVATGRTEDSNRRGTSRG